jgi:DNA-binding transcriptional MerR regulator
MEIPDKPYYRIGEVAGYLGVETHVLRYWESVFPQLKPVRAPSRQRLFRREDIQSLLTIKGLLHDQGYTIAGARRYLEENAAPAKPMEQKPLFQAEPAQPADPDLRQEMARELRAILKIISS